MTLINDSITPKIDGVSDLPREEIKLLNMIGRYA